MESDNSNVRVRWKRPPRLHDLEYQELVMDALMLLLHNMEMEAEIDESRLMEVFMRLGDMKEECAMMISEERSEFYSPSALYPPYITYGGGQ